MTATSGKLRAPGTNGLLLYTRKQCHLCDQAAALLRAAGIAFRSENIDLNLGLIKRYGNRVPVLHDPGSGRDLGWPFDREDLAAFVAAAKR